MLEPNKMSIIRAAKLVLTNTQPKTYVVITGHFGLFFGIERLTEMYTSIGSRLELGDHTRTCKVQYSLLGVYCLP